MKTELFFKNGKQKKKYMLCENNEKIMELKRLYGRKIVECVDIMCPYYSLGCKR